MVISTNRAANSQSSVRRVLVSSGETTDLWPLQIDVALIHEAIKAPRNGELPGGEDNRNLRWFSKTSFSRGVYVYTGNLITVPRPC